MTGATPRYLVGTFTLLVFLIAAICKAYFWRGHGRFAASVTRASTLLQIPYVPAVEPTTPETWLHAVPASTLRA